MNWCQWIGPQPKEADLALDLFNAAMGVSMASAPVPVELPL
jgi:hypothetical protein